MPMSTARSSAGSAWPAASSSIAPASSRTRSARARAVLRRVGAHRDAGLAFGDEEEGDAGAVVDAAADARRDDERVGRAAGGNDDLGAAQLPGVARARGLRLDVAEAIARMALFLGQDDDLPAFGDALQPERGRRRVAARLEQAGRDQRDRGVRLEDEAAAELLEHDHRVDRAEAEAALRFRHLQADDAEVGDLLPRLAREAAGLDDRTPALEVVAALDPAAHRVAQHLLVVGEVEVHVSSRARFARRCSVAPRCCRRRSSSCAC